MTLGEKLKRLRILTGITQADMAKQTQISAPTLSCLEQDTRPLTMKNATRLAKFYNTTTEELLDPDITAEELYAAHHSAAIEYITTTTPNIVPNKLVCTAEIIRLAQQLFAMPGFSQNDHAELLEALNQLYTARTSATASKPPVQKSKPKSSQASEPDIPDNPIKVTATVLTGN